MTHRNFLEGCKSCNVYSGSKPCCNSSCKYASCNQICTGARLDEICMDTYIVVSVATTCDDTSFVAKDSGEIIELCWATVDSVSLVVSPPQRVVIRPANTPITPHCTKIHGISWDHVREGVLFKQAISQMNDWINLNVISVGKQFAFVAVDAAVMRVHLPREARDKAVVLPAYLQHPRVFDLLHEYSNWLLVHAEALPYPATTLANVASGLQVDVDVNVHHEALTDVVATILVLLIQKSLPLESHPTVLTRPYDAAHDALVFLAERSTILHLCNLPPDTTQSELESWFTHHGGRPIAFWTLSNLEGSASKKGIYGFAVFSKHEDAAELLALNGRVFNDYIVEVQASSTRVLDRANDILTPFPLSKNKPRPGDWNCPSCGFSNFQRRTACFRCSFPSSSSSTRKDKLSLVVPSAASIKSSLYDTHTNPSHYRNAVPFRAGDWKCSNELCQYHNFAKNLCCLKCGSAKPPVTYQGPSTYQANMLHNVNLTAAAIAAATASGQPLNFSYQNFRLQQTQTPQLQQLFLQQRQFKTYKGDFVSLMNGLSLN